MRPDYSGLIISIRNKPSHLFMKGHSIKKYVHIAFMFSLYLTFFYVMAAKFS